MQSLSLVLSLYLSVPRAAFASITIQDPSDVIDPQDWAADNALFADYDIAFIETQPSDLLAAYVFDENTTALFHETLTVNANDTSVILVSDGAGLDLSYVDVIKYGYSSNLNEASFWGFNAAINVANQSSATLDHVNITVHNGAANIYSYGTETVVNVTNSWLYSSGPVSHGLYASGNGTIHASGIQHYSGGRRSSAFSGDTPKGIIYVSNSISRAQGIGSATFYALGEIFADNVVSVSEQGPVVFMDGAQNVTIANSDCTAGLLGGMAIFSSSTRIAGGRIEVTDSKITTTGSEMPGLWFGNVIIDVVLNNAKIETASGILVNANYSQITQDFDYYADYTDNSALQPAEVSITVVESSLSGDLVPYNESTISWNLTSYSSWAGSSYSGYGSSYVNVYLDATSNWTLTGDSYVQNFTSADTTLANVISNGYTLYYNADALENEWLESQTISISGGGSVTPGTES